MGALTSLRISVLLAMRSWLGTTSSIGSEHFLAMMVHRGGGLKASIAILVVATAHAISDGSSISMSRAGIQRLKHLLVRVTTLAVLYLMCLWHALSLDRLD